MPRGRIIAVDPGRQEFGVCILEDFDLRYYAVKSLRAHRAPDEAGKVAAHAVARLVDFYRPQLFVIEQPAVVQRHAEALGVVIRELKAAARGRHLSVREYGPMTVRRLICGDAALATKRETAERIASLYPELGKYLRSQNGWARRYYAHLFDAIAVGLAGVLNTTDGKGLKLNRS